eukprot:247077_1
MNTLTINYPQAESEPEPLDPGLPTPSVSLDYEDESKSGLYPSPFPLFPPPTETEDHYDHRKSIIYSIIEEDEELDVATPSQNESSPPPDQTTSPVHSDDTMDKQQDDTKQSQATNSIDPSKPMSVAQFKSIDIEQFVLNDDSLRDNYEIARKICKTFDKQFGDTDTVCLVAETGKQPQISYWCQGDYVRKDKNICNGKHILIYRANKHIPAKQPIVSHEEFVKFIKQLSLKNRDQSCAKIGDILDDTFGKGCHYARSKTKKPAYDIYCRFSNKYECGFRLPSGSYIIAWRR